MELLLVRSSLDRQLTGARARPVEVEAKVDETLTAFEIEAAKPQYATFIHCQFKGKLAQAIRQLFEEAVGFIAIFKTDDIVISVPLIDHLAFTSFRYHTLAFHI